MTGYRKILKILKENKIVINNFGYLSFLQIFDLLLPILTYPYLIRVLGANFYGLVAYSQAIVGFCSILINFGFNVSATKDISVNRNDRKVLAEIINSVLFIKVVLFVISFLVLIIFVYLIPALYVNRVLYILAFGICLNEVLFASWYFQGIEKMKYITFINIISRSLFTILIFFYIKKPSDYLLVPALNNVGIFVAGSVSVYLIFLKGRIRIYLPKMEVIFRYVKESFPFFFSRVTSIILMRTNTLLIGSFFSYTEVAYYDLAAKISDLCKIPSGLFNQTIYPRVSITKDMQMVMRIIKYNFVLSLFIYFGVFIFINHIIGIIGGNQMFPAKPLILFLNLTTPLAGISYFLGNTMLVVKGYSNAFNWSIIYETILYGLLVVALFVSNFYTIYLLAAVIILCSLFEVGYRYYYVRAYKII